MKQDGNEEGPYAEHAGNKQIKKRGKPPLGVQNQWKKLVKKGKHGSRADPEKEEQAAAQPDNPSSSNHASTHNGPGLCKGTRLAIGFSEHSLVRNPAKLT